MMADGDIKYDNLLVYYFSGTGNAKSSAQWIGKYASESGLNARIVNIDRFQEVTRLEMPEGTTLTGICYPAHGFNAPPIVYRFIRKMEKGRGNRIFLLNTRAGMKLSKVFLPGLSGLALLWPALLLMLKGYRIVDLRPVDLPSNWISLHPGLKKKVVDSIFEKWEKKTRTFSQKLIKGQRMFPNFISLPFDLAVSPLSIGYYYFGRYMLAKTYIATSACTSCNICEKRCPTHSIRMIHGRPYWKFTCESCMRCMNICPHRAIETAHSVTALLWYLCWTAIPGLFLYFLASKNLLWGMENWMIVLLYYIFAVPLSFSLVYVSYRLLHYGMRYRPVNWIVANTSLTHFSFWRRYKPKVSN
jgi:Pyruvate/2-oxoacid:ferredoxin oxidoreductase delta subunit